MSTALAERPSLDAKAVESALVGGDLSKLTPDQRVSYYNGVCQSLGLNPLTQPFAYITLNGKLRLYALKDATEQLRKIHGVSITAIASQKVDDVFVVTAHAQDRTGRTDAATGAVAIGTLKGEALANALMKAETKAKRRATLSICGLGMLDETEAETLPQPVVVEAPQRVKLPEGASQILKAVAKSARGASWSEVTFVNWLGEERTMPTPADGTAAAVSVFEQLAQEAVPVWLECGETPRSKKMVIKAVHREPRAAVVVLDNNAIDSEIAEKDAAF